MNERSADYVFDHFEEVIFGLYRAAPVYPNSTVLLPDAHDLLKNLEKMRTHVSQLMVEARQSHKYSKAMEAKCMLAGMVEMIEEQFVMEKLTNG